MPLESIQLEIIWALSLGALFPIFLLVSKYSSLNVSRRYIASAVIVIIFYGFLCFFNSSNPVVILAGLLLLLSILIFTLGLWGLLTRGYSVALLVTLHSLGGNATIAELEKTYSGGRGLKWLTVKRLNGLSNAKIIKIEESQITIRKPLGPLLIKLYKTFQQVFQLKGYG